MSGDFTITNGNGDVLFQCYFGEARPDEGGEVQCVGNCRNDGVFSEDEIKSARDQFEKEANRRKSWFNRSYNYGGYYLQPWRLEGTDPAPVPEGFSMKVTLRLKERYLGDSIFSPERILIKEVPMTVSWEQDKIRIDYSQEDVDLGHEHVTFESTPLSSLGSLGASIGKYVSNEFWSADGSALGVLSGLGRLVAGV